VAVRETSTTKPSASRPRSGASITLPSMISADGAKMFSGAGSKNDPMGSPSRNAPPQMKALCMIGKRNFRRRAIAKSRMPATRSTHGRSAGP
jgi:hypothetical protein